MTRPSRYVRPASPAPLSLQPRDHAVLRAVHEHRYLHSDRLRELLFPNVSSRRVRRRLRQLWEHKLLDRYYKPIVLHDGMTGPRTSRPLYTIAHRGAQLLEDDLGRDAAAIPHTPRQNAVGFATLEHHLVVTDFFVALACACRDRSDIALERIERENVLRSRQASSRRESTRRAASLVSDGAVTLRYPGMGASATFHIEVVRAGVRGGNKTLIEKLRRYAQLHHRGFFARVYGHTTVRAILIATTSDARAARLRELASKALVHGRRLFWFGSYRAPAGERITVPAFTQSTVLGPLWTDVDATTHSLIAPEAPSQPATERLG